MATTMTPTLKTRGLLSSPQTLIDGELPPTLGPDVVRWMESNLVYGPGDMAGEPYRVDPFLRSFIYRLYEYDPRTGRRLVRRALLGVPKGNSKSEIAGATGALELAGPCVVGPDGAPALRTDPDVAMGAASYEQADIVYGAARAMVDPIAPFLDRFDKETLIKGRPGRMYRVAAVAGTNDGRRPTCFIADELHEWVGRERVHLVMSNGLAKRTDSLELNITTAGADPDSVCGRLYDYGMKLASGEVEDSSFLFMWWQASDHWNLDDSDELRAAVAEANPASWVDPETLAKRYEVDRMPEHEFRRYHLNQWVTAGEEWLPPQAWSDLADDREVSDGSKVVLGFDGSYKRDSTALYGFTVDEPYGFLLGAWERPENAASDWRVPREEVKATLADTFQRFEVVGMLCDPYRWESEIDEWAEAYGDVVLEFPTNSRKRMTQACGRFYSAVIQGDFTHDGSPTVTRHLANAVVKDTPDGSYITKDSADSPRKIDAAVAAIIAWEAASVFAEHETPAPFVMFGG